MSELTNINNLDQAKIEDSLAFLREFLLEGYPNMDLDEGRVLYDLLLTPGAEIQALTDTQMDNLRKSMSLLDIIENPDLAEEYSIDKILANYRITAREGTNASGSITIETSNNTSTVVSEGSIFTYEDKQYAADQGYISTTGDILSNSNRPIRELDNGNYAFSINVTAVTSGSTQALKKSTEVVWESPSSNYVKSYAESDFTDGTDPDDNQTLLDRLLNGLATKILSGRGNISAMLKEYDANVRDVSTIGLGDREMLRDRHNIFGMSTGGKADIYVRTASYPQTITLEKSCILLDKINRVFQCSIERGDYPGFYSIEAIYPANVTEFAGSLDIISQTRGTDMSDLTYIPPDIATITEGAFTRYQIATAQFIAPDVDTSTMVENVSAVVFKVDVSGIPSIATLQDYVMGRDTRNPQADYLVRAAIPMRVAVSMDIDYVTGDEEISVSDVQTAVATAVNNLGFFGRLPVSVIVKAAFDALTGNSTVRSPVTMLGKLRKPDGNVLTYISEYELTIPTIDGTSVSPRTATFYLDPEDVSVTISSANNNI